MNKYITITKDNVKDYLFTDVECVFGNDFPEYGYLTGVYSESYDNSYVLYFQCDHKNQYSMCKVINPDYQEPEKDLNEIVNDLLVKTEYAEGPIKTEFKKLDLDILQETLKEIIKRLPSE